MKFALFRSFRAILVLTFLCAAAGMAAETATISAGTVNVRGRAGFIGEVVTRLSRGDTVTVLEAVTVKNPKAGEPADWLKIALPANTPVWINTSFVDPATLTINASRLKVRGGPGINFSVLGYLTKGSTVKEIRRQGDWMEIEPTEELFAFIAASMVTKGTTAAAIDPAATNPATTPAAPATTVATPVDSTAPATTTAPVETPAAQTSATPAGADLGTPQSASPATTKPTTTAIVAEPAPAIATAPIEPDRELTVEERAQQALETRTRDSQRWEVASEPDDKLLKELPEHRRLVVREGKVHRSISIQAPSGYILEHVESGLRLNYLYTTSTNVPLKELLGIKVRIKGEEGIDSRWPGTPVLLIKSLEVLP
jgi:uncharacterized protein YraI